MRRIACLVTVIAASVLVCNQAHAQNVIRGPGCCPPPGGPYYQPGAPYYPPAAAPEKEKGKEGAKEGAKDGQPSPDTQAPSTDAFSQPPPAGGAAAESFNPAMFGDLIGGPQINALIRLPNGSTRVVAVGLNGISANQLSATGAAPVIGRGAFKIADNESPRPTDRAFITYNYFDGVRTSLPGISSPDFNLSREVIGFEKTFLEGDASIGLRLPFLQLNGAFGGLDNTQIGDLSIVLKWAFLNDRQTGDVASVGVVITAPTGDPFISFTGDTIHDTLIQPYMGYIFNRGNFFIHGFESVVIPTTSEDVTLFLSDFGIGYKFLTQDREAFFKGIVPTFEAHVVTPLDHRGEGGTFAIGHVPDYVSLTAGVNAVFGCSSTLGFALGVPVTGPRPYNFEGICSLNIRF